MFELDSGEHHDHIVCVNCGHVEEFFDPQIEARQQEIAKERGYRLREHEMHLYVECIKEDCPRRNAGKQARPEPESDAGGPLPWLAKS